MAKLPYDRVVHVTLTRNQNFPSRRGFGTPIFITDQAVSGQLDASHRTKLYSSMAEVDADFNAGDEFYDAALLAFSQNPQPIAIKAGFITLGSGADEDDVKDQLDILYDADPDWYFLSAEASMLDVTLTDGFIEWIAAKNKFAILDSWAAGTEDSGNTTVVAARKKNTTDRTAVFYQTDTTQYGGFALAALLSTFNFDEADSAYTAKFKELQGIVALNKSSAVITAVTGFVEALGQDSDEGHMANCQIDIGGQHFVVEGSTLTQNVFIDEVHATDWIIARTEEQALGIFLNAKRVPFTDNGMEQLAAAARTVMAMARRAGLIAEDLNPTTGKYEAAVNITVPSALSVPEDQRKARIAPNILVRFRYAGAVHYTTINYTMAF